ncbi:TPA: hypothetical protein RG647_RS08980 [Providencia rettgeri]|nr:hypothetical protein [Providencia rettgeri]
MFGEIPAAIAAIRESLNLFKVVNDAKNQADIDNAVYEINRKLHDIQMENTKLLEVINEKQKSIMLLEKSLSEANAKNADKEKWSSESVNYEAWSPMIGTTIYRKKLSEDSVGKFAYFCTHCYESGKASTLSINSVRAMQGIGTHIATLKCNLCGSEYLSQASKLKNS